MRSVRLSITFNDQLNELLAHGEKNHISIVDMMRANESVYESEEQVNA